MRNIRQKQSEREAQMWVLAGRLEFAVEKAGERFTLIRTADVAPPVRVGEQLHARPGRGISRNLEIARPRIAPKRFIYSITSSARS